MYLYLLDLKSSKINKISGIKRVNSHGPTNDVKNDCIQLVRCQILKH